MELAGFTQIGKILQSGIYALVYRREVVYVGKSKTMLVRIYSHRNAWGDKRQGKRRETPSWSPVKGILFDDVWILPTPTDQLDAREQEMIAKYRPKYNIKLKPPVGVVPLSQVIGALAQRPPEGFVRRV